MTVKAELGNSAARYWRQGIPIFPVHGTDHGMCSFEDQKCKHPGKYPITRQCRQWPDANIGMPTGAVTATLVLDIDPRNGGEESLGRLEAEHGHLPDTAKQKTGGGGWHLFFQDPGILVPKTLAPGIDLKAEGAKRSK